MIVVGFGELAAQYNRWWPMRTGQHLEWRTGERDPVAVTTNVLGMIFREGVGVWTSADGKRFLGDARGIVRVGQGYLPQSKRRLPDSQLRAYSSTHQVVMFPDVTDANYCHFAAPREMESRMPGGNGGYETTTLIRINMTTGDIEDLSELIGYESIPGYVINETMAAASFPDLGCSWFAFTRCTGYSWTRSEFDSLELFAYRVSGRNVVGPVRSVVAGTCSEKNQFTFSRSGRFATMGRAVAAFDPVTGVFSTQKVLAVPATRPNGLAVYPLVAGIFSPSEELLYLPSRLANDTGRVGIHMLQYDLTDPADTISPLADIDVEDGVWGVGTDFMYTALGPDCRLYLSMVDYVGRIEYPDLRGAACTINPVWLRSPSSAAAFPSYVITSLPNLANQMTIPMSGKSCLWPEVTVTSDTICVGSCASVRATYYNSVDSWEWSFPGGAPSTYVGRDAPCIDYDRAGTYPVTLVVGNRFGRDTIQSVVVVRSAPSVNAGGDVTVCPGGSVRLTATGAERYVWSPETAVDDATSPTPVVRAGGGRRVLTVTGTDQWGCSATDTIVVMEGELTATVHGAASICAGSAVELRAEGGLDYQWWPATGLSTTTAAVVLARPAETTTYGVEVRSGDCVDTAWVTVTVTAQPRVEVSVTDTVVCSGSALHMRATVDGVADGESAVRWWADTSGVPLSTTAALTLMATTDQRLMVTATTDDGCADTAWVDVRVATSDTAIVDTTICRGAVVNIGTQSYRPLSDTTVTTERRTSDGCVDVDVVRIRVTDLTLHVESVEACRGDSVTLTAVTTATDVVWTHADVIIGRGHQLIWRVENNDTLRVTAQDGACRRDEDVSIRLRDRATYNVRVGSATADAGTLATTALDVITPEAVPLVVRFAATSPGAILIDATGLDILNDGRDGGEVVVRVPSSGRYALRWFVYLQASLQTVLEPTVDVDTSCATVLVAGGNITRTGCAAPLRAVAAAPMEHTDIYTLHGSRIASVGPGQPIPPLHRGTYVFRLFTSTTSRSVLVAVGED